MDSSIVRLGRLCCDLSSNYIGRNTLRSSEYVHEEHAGELSKFSFYKGGEVNKVDDRTVSKTTTESLFFKDDAVVL